MPTASPQHLPESSPWSRTTVVAALLVLGAGIGAWAYAPGIDVPYYGDDFQLYFPALGMEWTDHFVRTGPTTGFYRPLQNAVLSVIQSAAGMNPVPVHVLTLLLHVGTVAVVYEGSRWIGASRVQAVVATVLMAVAQINAAAVLGNDTLSQVGSTLFGYLSLRCYGQAVSGRRAVRTAYAGALTALAVALLFKESAFAFAPLLVLVDVATAPSGWGTQASLTGRAKRLAPVLALAAGYLLLRSAAGAMSPGFGSGPYQLALGGNVIRNAVLFGAAATSVIPTPQVAEWAQTGQWAHVAAAGVGSLGLVTAVGWGVYRSGRGRTAAVLLAVSLASLAPVLALNDVSELYVYSAMPPLCILAALAAGPWLHAAPPGQRAAVAALLLGVAVSQAVGVRHKAALMDATGKRTQAVLKQIAETAAAAPDDARLCLQDASPPTADADTTAYSVYRMPGALPLIFAEPVVRHLASRPDVHLTTAMPSCPPEATVLRVRSDGWTVSRDAAH
jgi:hypothetical protein